MEEGSVQQKLLGTWRLLQWQARNAAGETIDRPPRRRCSRTAHVRCFGPSVGAIDAAKSRAVRKWRLATCDRGREGIRLEWILWLLRDIYD